MDPQLELIFKALDTLRADQQRGFDGVHERLDVLNGRVRKAESSIAVLNERTDGMVCAEHSATFAHLRDDVTLLKAERQVQQASVSRPAAQAGSLAGGAVSGALVVLYGVWQWWTTK